MKKQLDVMDRLMNALGLAPAPPRPVVHRQFTTYWNYPKPSYQDLRYASNIFDIIFSQIEGLMYCFGGPFTARSQGWMLLEVTCIDVILDKKLLNNNGRRLDDIVDAHCKYLAWTPDGRLIVVIRHNWGVAINMLFTEDTIPVKLIPDRNFSHFRNQAIHGEATFCYRTLVPPGTGDAQLPMLKWQHLLRDSLLRLDTDPARKEEMEMYWHEIQAFLILAEKDGDGPFSAQEIASLRPKVRIWIGMASQRVQRVISDRAAAVLWAALKAANFMVGPPPY